MVAPWERNWAEPEATASDSGPWSKNWAEPEKQPEQSGDTAKGFKRAFAQIPELGYGTAALASMSAEKLFGEGGLSTAAKNYFGEKVAARQSENQKYAPSVEFTDAWGNLKQGDIGSMVDWLQDSAGYVAGQAIQTAVTGGIGALVGKAGLATLTQKMLGGVVAKQAAKIAEESAVKAGLTGAAAELAVKAALPEATKIAAQRTAQVIGAGIALQAQNLGMEAGDIYGGLTEEARKTGKEITGDDLLRAWGAAAAAAGTETATDLLGLGAVTGRLNIGKMTGLSGRAARAGVAAGVGLPIEAGQEYIQTGLEQYGAGQRLDTPEAERERINAAAVGGLGGTIVGGGAGLISSAQPAAAVPIQGTGQPVSDSPIASTSTIERDGQRSVRTSHQDGSIDVDGVQVAPPREPPADPIADIIAPATPILAASGPDLSSATDAAIVATQSSIDATAERARFNIDAMADRARSEIQQGLIASAQNNPNLGVISPNLGTEEIAPEPPISAPAETAPKTVGGIPVSAQSTEQLQAIAQSPETPATTRHAAVAAVQSRIANPDNSQVSAAPIAPNPSTIAPNPSTIAPTPGTIAPTPGTIAPNTEAIASSAAEKAAIAAEKVAPVQESAPSTNREQPAAADKVDNAAPKVVKEPTEVDKGPEVERFQGQYGKGMAERNARAMLPNLAKKKPNLAWTVEKTANPAFPDRFDVVGRSVAQTSETAQEAAKPVEVKAPAVPMAAPEKEAQAGVAPVANSESAPNAVFAVKDAVRVPDVYGRFHYVSQADLDSTRAQLRLYNPNGDRLQEGGTIHRENIDLTGEKRAETNKQLPYIAREGDKPFKTRKALDVALRVKKQNPADWIAKEIDGGFIAVRAAESAKVENASPAPAAQAAEAVKEPWQMTKAEWAGGNQATGQHFAPQSPAYKQAAKAHQTFVEQALAADKPVPASVLADYPDLTKSPSKSPAPAPQAEPAKEAAKLLAKPTGQPVGGYYATDTEGNAIGHRKPGESPRRFKTAKEADIWARKHQPTPVRTVITPSEDAVIGKNDAGEQLYERSDGSVYRMHRGRPYFGGDLVPVVEAPAKSGKPRMGETADELYAALRKAANGVVATEGRGGIVYPVIRLPAVGGTYRMEPDGSYVSIGNGGMTVTPATKREIADIEHGIETDTAQVEMHSRWGGSGSDTSSKFISTLHSPSGNSWAQKAAPQQAEPAPAETPPAEAPKTIAESSPADLLRAAADKLEGKSATVPSMKRSPVVTPPTQEQIVQILRDHPLIKLRESVKNAYLIGSQVTGKTRPIGEGKSDVDILLEVAPKKGFTADELTQEYHKALQNYFVKNNIKGVQDDVHPQWEGHRVDVYFTYDASKEDDRPKTLLQKAVISSAPATPAQESAPNRSEATTTPEDQRIRALMGLDKSVIDAYNPQKSVEKVGRHWSYALLNGKTHQAMFDTKTEAIAAAERYKALKGEQYDDPSSFYDVTALNAGERLKLIDKYIAQGMSEMQAGERARAEISDASTSQPNVGTSQQEPTAAPSEQGKAAEAVVETRETDKGTALYSRTGIISSTIFDTDEANRDKTDELQRILRAKGDDFTITPALLSERSPDGGGKRGDNAGAVQADHYRLGEKVAGVFGKQIVWMTADGPFEINGVVIAGSNKIGRYVFIDARSENPAHVVLGHKLTHHMEIDAPGIYKALRSAIDGLLRNHAQYREIYGMGPEHSDYRISAEIVGDLMGDNFGNREFWNLIAKESPSKGMFRVIANTVKKWIDKLLPKLKMRGLGSEQFVTDMRAAQVVLAQAVRDYAEIQRNTGAVSETDKGTALFDRGESVAPGITVSTLRAEISKAFGPKATAMVGDILIPLDTQAQIADVSELADVVPLIREGDRISGFYHPATGKTYAILENLAPEGVKGLALHEIGVHYGMEGMLGKDRYAQLSRQLDAMRRAGNKVVIEAHRQATEQAAKPSQVPEETLAYLVTSRPELPFVKRIIAQIKAFLFRKFGILGDKLTVDDIAALARASVLHASEGVKNGDAQFSRSHDQTQKFVDIDSLPQETQDDIFYTLTNEVRALLDVSESEFRGQIIDLVDPIVVQQKTVPIASVTMDKQRQGSASRTAVEKYKKLTTKAPPILVDGSRLVEGGHRYVAAIERGDKTINVVDVGPLLRMDWFNWQNASEKIPSDAVRSNLKHDQTQTPKFSRSQDQTQTEAFRRWFGDSKVVDAEGKPLVVYHGTTGDITIFELEKGGLNTDARSAKGGIFFASQPSVASQYSMGSMPQRLIDLKSEWRAAEEQFTKPIYSPMDYSRNGQLRQGARVIRRTFLSEATDVNRQLVSDTKTRFKIAEQQWLLGHRDFEGANVIAVYLSLKNPLVVNDSGSGYRDVSYAEVVEKAKAAGNDGVIIQNTFDNLGKRESEHLGDIFVVFSPTQIKSAIGNRGTFDPKNPDIRFSRNVARGGAGAWNPPNPSKLDNLIYTLQDKQIDTRRVLQAIREAGKQIGDALDVYLQEELFHGRAAKETQDFIDGELKPLITEMAARKVTMAEFEEYLHARHAEEANIVIAARNPNMPNGGSGMYTEVAQAYLDTLDPAKKRAFEALAKRIDAINEATRQLLVDAELESQDTIDTWKAAYQHYVPLHREDMGGGPGIGQGFSIRGPASKMRTGSSRTVVDILGNIAIQREKAIVRAEKNVVSKALYGLAKANPSPDFWSLAKPGVTTSISAETGDPVDVIDMSYQGRDNVVMHRSLGKDGKIVQRGVEFDQHNERALRMAIALKNLDANEMGEILSASAKVTRYFASVNTQYNPIFGVVNLTRDSQQAMFNLSTTPIAGKQTDVAKHILPALKGIYLDLRAERSGQHQSSAWAQLFEEFQKEGGKTGYRDMFRTGKDRAEALQRELGRAGEGKAKQFGRAVFDWLSDYNTAMENAVRLAAYKVGKESGMTNQRAASMAKNLTVNFNRKGQITTQAGALYAFFNASVQGSTRIIETLNGPMGRKIIVGGITLGAIQALMLAAAGFDDDEPPQFIRERSTIIPIGDKKYITIPMPLGLHFIPNIGRIATEFALSGFRDPGKRVAGLLNVFADAFNPVGSAGLSLQTITPTVIDPIAALAENKDWTGKPIARQDMSQLSPTPGHTRAKDTSSAFSKGVSKALNYASGGTNYKPGLFSPTPDQIDYLIGQATGGIGREAMKVEQSLGSVFTGEDLPTYKIPLVGRFYGDVEQQSSQGNTYYSNIKKLNEHEAEIKGRRKAGEPLGDYLKDNPEARLFQMANKVERDVSALRKQKRELISRDASTEAIKAKDVQITARMKLLNDRVKQISAQAQ